jgi:hypothetical protein
MMPNGSKSVIDLIMTLDKLELIAYDKHIRNFESLMWDFASTASSTGNILEDIDAKLYTDEVYRTREKERALQALLGRIKTSDGTTR